MSFYSNIEDNSRSPLTEEAMIAVMTDIMEGKVADETIGIFLKALAERGETVQEITGAARVMRAKALPIKAPDNAVDCCGTGGDHSGTYNISTAVALVAASCGVPVAKHGNRASTSRSGAADVLEALGVNLDTPHEQLETILEELNFAFLMAPKHHTAMAHVRTIRKKLGTRTIFNLLGPLSNPAGTKRQLIGVFDKKWLVPLAETLNNLGTERAWLVHGSDGLDEITVTGPTHVVQLEHGTISETTLTPDDFGLRTWDANTLKGGNAQENAEALRSLLEGQDNAYRDIVLANTAAVLCLHGTAETIKEGVHKARESIDNQAALTLLNRYILRTNGA